MRQIYNIWKKEIKDTIRDKRTLMSMLVMPLVLMPAILIGIGKLAEYQMRKLEEQEIKVAFVNPQASALENFVVQLRKFRIVTFDGEIKTAIKNDEVNIGVLLPSNFDSAINAQQPTEILVYQDSTNTSSVNAFNRFNLAVNAFNDQTISQRFASQNINQQILAKIISKPADVASDKERGGFGLGLLLPMFIVIWSIAGGQYTAIDVSAGEKERKTLESILLTPAKRIEIVLGKFMAVATTSLVSVVVSLGSLYAAMSFGFGALTNPGGLSGTGGTNFSIDLGTLLLLFVVSLLLVVMFSAIQLSIGIFAKNYKEAQSYIGPAYLIVVLPIAVLNTLPNYNPELWFYFLPVVNALSLFKELLLGVYDLSHILATIFSLLVYSAFAIVVTLRIYSKEEVLFTS